MPDRKTVMSWLEGLTQDDWQSFHSDSEVQQIAMATLELLKEHDSLLGIQQTADSITFISTGTAQVAEKRGILLGKLLMHEWLEKKLLYSGLLTDDIRTVFDEARQL